MVLTLEERLAALTVKEVADRLRLDIHTVYRLIRRHDLRAIKIGNTYRVPFGAFDDYLSGSTAEPRDPVADERAAKIKALWAEYFRENEGGLRVTLAELEAKYGVQLPGAATGPTQT
jgi:excisionase family DNA binding protein